MATQDDNNSWEHIGKAAGRVLAKLSTESGNQNMLSEKDLEPKGVIFGRATGYVQNRLNIIVQNYRGRTLNRELALMNLKQHGVDGETAEEMLGPPIPDLETTMRGDDNIELAKLNRREVIDIPSGRESVKGRRDGDPPGRRFK